MVTTLIEVNGMRNRQEGYYHSAGLRTKIQSKRDRKMSRVAQEYRSCLLSGCAVFHAGERGEECTQGNKKKEKQQKMGKSPIKTLLEKVGFHA